VILATSAEYRMIEATLKRLDITPLQVLIEVTIAEVGLIDDLRYGLQWFFESGDASATFSSLASGAVASAFPGFSFVFAGSDARVVLNALTEITDVRVISSPQLMVLDNQSARLQVGDQVPIAIQSSVTVNDPDAPIVNSIQFRDTGVILEVTPRVNAGGLVVLDVLQEVSDVVETTTSDIDSPTIQQRFIQSTVAVQSGDTVALGGLIRDRQEESVSGLPLLSEIPILGNLFKTTEVIERRTELLVLITPRVVRNRREALEVTDELRRRLSTLGPLEKEIQAPE
jgi:general secretion pathway protein D